MMKLAAEWKGAVAAGAIPRFFSTGIFSCRLMGAQELIGKGKRLRNGANRLADSWQVLGKPPHRLLMARQGFMHAIRCFEKAERRSRKDASEARAERAWCVLDLGRCCEKIGLDYEAEGHYRVAADIFGELKPNDGNRHDLRAKEAAGLANAYLQQLQEKQRKNELG